MAIPMRTFGNTLSELQAGTNAAQGLDYQRANAQDAINAQRLQAFLQLQGQKFQTQARQSELAADRAQRMAELLQQNQQFGTREANLMKIAEMEAKSRLDVARERGADPRIALGKMEIEEERRQRAEMAQALTVRRRAALAEIKAGKADKFWSNGPEYGAWKNQFGREPDVAGATARLNALDTEATGFGLSLTADGLGYEIPGLGGNQSAIGQTQQSRSGAPWYLETPNTTGSVLPTDPAPAPAAAPYIPYLGMGGVLPFVGGGFRGAGAGSSWRDPVPPMIQPTPQVVPSDPVNKWRKGPNGWMIVN